MGEGVFDVRAVNQSREEDRKGSKKRTEGRVKPWSRTSAGGSASGFALAAWARRSLFFRTRRRFLREIVTAGHDYKRYENTLRDMI